MTITGRVRNPIPNNKLANITESVVSEVNSYKLTPEQLEEYKRTGIFPSKDKESVEPMKDSNQEIDHVDTYILLHEAVSAGHTCHSLAEAITHIKSNYTIAEIETDCIPKIYQEIPVDFSVNVVVGK